MTMKINDDHPAAPAIEICGVTKAYGRHEALKGIDLVVPRGQLFALLGPNGAGKTTLFSILATLRSPTHGYAKVLGHDVVEERNLVRKKMGIVFQDAAIEPRLSGRDNLLIMGMIFGLKMSESRQRADEVIVALDIGDVVHRPAKSLSGGERRRLELARAMMTNPEILFLDEATLGLDVEGRRIFWRQIRHLVGLGRTVFFTTHYMEEAEVADQIALVNEGRIVGLGTPHDLKAEMGGNVLRLVSPESAGLHAWVVDRGFKAIRDGEIVTISHPDPGWLVPELVPAVPFKLNRVEIHKPSIEDVFIKLTGRTISEETEVVEAAERPECETITTS